VLDSLPRYVPALDPRFSYRGADVVPTLERVCGQVGYCQTIRLDQGPELMPRDPDLWAYQKVVTRDFSRLGKPTDNAFIEGFNGRFQADCLDQNWFLSLADGRGRLQDWRRYYNEEWPHGVIGSQSPLVLVKSGDVASPSP
jgi:putative transposase